MPDNKQDTVPKKPGLNWDPTEHYKSTKVAEEYDKVRFSSLAGRVFQRLERHQIIKGFAHLPANSLILDAPCGTGRLAEHLLEMGHRVVGMDISPNMLEVASRRLERFGERFSTRVQDARELVNEEKQFDAALCARVLMHFELEGQITFLRGVAHVTRGTVVFNQSIDNAYFRFRRGVKRALGHQESAGYPITVQDLNTLVREAGRSIKRRRWLLPIVSEAVFVSCE